MPDSGLEPQPPPGRDRELPGDARVLPGERALPTVGSECPYVNVEVLLPARVSLTLQ